MWDLFQSAFSTNACKVLTSDFGSIFDYYRELRRFPTHLSNLNLTLAIEWRGQGLSRTLVFFLSDVQLCMLYWIRILCLQTSRSMIPFEKTKMSRCTFISCSFFFKLDHMIYTMRRDLLNLYVLVSICKYLLIFV